MTVLKYRVEALLMAASEPLTIERMLGVFEEFERPTPEELLDVLGELALDYEPRAIELSCLASGYLLKTKKCYSTFVARLWTEKPQKYSNALLEVLAIIAYKQPVTRADIEEVRGVALSTSMLKTLLEREWIVAAGHRDVPGKPSVYVTTKTFLDYFNLASLSELPSLDK